MNALWSMTTKNSDCSTGPLARPFARSLAPLTRSLAPDCSLRSRPPLRSPVRSLAHFAHSLARGTVNDWMAILSVCFSIIDHSAMVYLSSDQHASRYIISTPYGCSLQLKAAPSLLSPSLAKRERERERERERVNRSLCSC